MAAKTITLRDKHKSPTRYYPRSRNGQGGSVTLYQHNINYRSYYAYENDFQECCFSIITEDSTPFTFTTLIDYLKEVLPINDLGDTHPMFRKGIPATGLMSFGSDGTEFKAEKILHANEQQGNTLADFIACQCVTVFEEDNIYMASWTMFTLEETFTVDGHSYNTTDDVVVPINGSIERVPETQLV